MEKQREEASTSFPERFNNLFTKQRSSSTFHAIRKAYFKFPTVGILIARANKCTLGRVNTFVINFPWDLVDFLINYSKNNR